MIGYAYNNAGNKDEAIKYFKKSLELNSNENEKSRINELINELIKG